MNKNTIFGMALIFVLLIGYSYWMAPSKEELKQRQKTADSLMVVRKADSLAIANSIAQTKQIADTVQKVALKDTTSVRSEIANKNNLGYFSSSASGKDAFYTISSDLLTIKLTAKGGKIYSIILNGYQTFDSLPLKLFDGDSSRFGLEFNTEDLKFISTNDLYFQPFINGKPATAESYSVTGKDSLQFGMRLCPSGDSVADPNKYIEFVYTVAGNNFKVGIAANFVGMQNIIAQNTRDLNLDWKLNLLRQEKNLKNEQSQATIFYMDNTGEVNNITETKDLKESMKTPVKWISYKQQFFGVTLFSNTNFSSADMETITYNKIDTGRAVKTMHSSIIVPFDPSKDQTISMSMFAGPLKYKVLRKYGMNLERQIPLGWSFFLLAWINRFAVLPVFNFLEGFNLNYGIIILILTVLLKIVLLPIAYKTYLSSAKMRLLKPEVDEIGLKFPKKDDAMKKQQATMALYKKAGANPMSGCVPMLLQFPILIAMFRFFPASIELRQQPFLWAHDLSSYDSVLNLGFTIPFYGDHVSLFCLLMTISTILYTKMNNDMMASSNQMPGMKTMMYLMPIMFLGFFNSYSSGLSYYYLLANLLTFAQMFFIRRFVDEDKLHRQIQENKKKVVVKSGFQKRLEEMAQKQTKRK
ncbi:MAG: membrane protein insertase YidC [Bacteroidales bacterium]